MESVSPNIFVANIEQTVAFYTQLGFTLVAKVPDQQNYFWAMMTCGSVTFMFQTFNSLANELPALRRQPGASLLLYIQMRDIRQFHARIKDKVRIVKDLEKAPNGATEFSIQDNNEYILTFAEDE